METISRRRFLQLTGGAVVASQTVPMWLRLGPAGASPGPAQGRKLLVVLLNGGNDGLNTVIPYGMGAYHDARPGIRYSPEEVLTLPGNTEVGLNPSLAALHRLYGEDKVAVVQGVGYDQPTLSHFDSMDVWQSGDPTLATTTGWLGRYLDRSPAGPGSVIRAVAIGNELPLALRGEAESGVAIPSYSGFRFYDGSDGDPTSEPYRLHEAYLGCTDAPLGGRPAEALLTASARTVTAVRAVNEMADPKAKPPRTLAEQVGLALGLLRSDLGVEVAFVTLGGFDTHAAEQSSHPALLAELDAAVGHFTTEVAKTPNPGDYLLMTFSEFGRRVTENGAGGTAGTDHGTAAPLFVVGDAVAGGLYGEHPRLDAAGLDENGNLIRTVELREVYSTIIEGWLGGATAAEVLDTRPAHGLAPVPFLP
ncbi:MAG: DUF1501 domain-containing protein [Acidimicrobiia bacterium]